MKWWSRTLVWSLGLMVLASPMGTLAASLGDPQSKSTNYRVDESSVGAMGDYGEASANYKQLGGTDGGSSLGDLTVGTSTSSNYRVDAGSNTTNTPVLSFAITSASVNLGILSTATTATGTATFNIKNYTSSGYVVSIVGPPPTYNGRSLTALTTGSAPTPGTEQFGINLVANTAPISFGAGPIQVPSSSFSYGTVAAGYGTANQFKYADGDTLASSPKSSGETDFTISYIANVAPLTPAGVYTANQSLVATATF